MPEGFVLRDFACPKCTEKLRLDARFVQWCPRCGYGADPKPPELGKVALAEPVGGFLTAAKNRRATGKPVAPDRLWASVAEYVDSIPETERQRRKIVDRLRNTRTDRSHPANHLRTSLIEARPQLPGVLKLSEDEWAEIDAELAPGRLGVARWLLGS